MEGAMNKILIAIDDSEGALKAVDFVGRQFAAMSNLKIDILHVIPNLPAPLWDDGHILTEEEREARIQVIDKWLNNQKLKLKPMFDRAVGKLTKMGLSQDQIETRTVTDTLDVAESILNEVKTGDYQMLVIGRHGYSKAKRFLMGSVASAIINRGAGAAICVVE
jgi:nucleotide-binding universal stress UspA family protein